MPYVIAGALCFLAYLLQHHVIAPFEQEVFPSPNGIYISLLCIPFGIKAISVVIMGAKVWPFLMVGQYAFANMVFKDQSMALLVALSGTLALGIVASVLNYLCHRKWWETVDVKTEGCDHNMWRASLMIAFFGSALTIVFHTFFSLPQAASALSIRSLIGGMTGTISVILILVMLKKYWLPKIVLK